MALTNAPVEGSDVHPLDKVDHDRLSVAEEGALEVSEHLERKSREAAPATTRKKTTAGIADLLGGEAAEAERARVGQAPVAAAAPAAATRRSAAVKKSAAGSGRKKTATRKTATAKRGAASKRTASVARRSTAGSERARDVAAELLKKAGGEMAVADLAAKVVSSGRTKLGGKTPAATVAAQIYTAAKAGVLFKKTSRGHVALLKAKA